jgi:hypothetical protein
LEVIKGHSKPFLTVLQTIVITPFRKKIKKRPGVIISRPQIDRSQ